MLEEWQNEYGSDHLILMRGRGGKMSLGLNLFLLRRDPVFLFASYTKRTIAFTPVLDIFFPGKIGSWIFSPKIFTPNPNKNQMVAP